MPRRRRSQQPDDDDENCQDCPSDCLTGAPFEDPDVERAVRDAAFLLTNSRSAQILPVSHTESSTSTADTTSTDNISSRVRMLMKEFFSSNDYLEIPGVQELKYQTYAREYIAYHFHREGNLAPAKEDMLTYSNFLFSNGKRDGQNMTKEYYSTPEQ